MLDKKSTEIQWFRKAKFGLFIHWGLYAVTEGYWNGKETPGIGEWIAAKERISNIDYEKLADGMTCEKFNPELWAELAYNAGMRYCVFTAKHHEGFAMFDTQYDDYSIVKQSPYKKDIAKEICDAMRKKNIQPCFYYSQAVDFHEENAVGNTWDFEVPEDERDFDAYINGKCKYQIKELLSNYGDIGLIWMDVPKRMTEEIAADLKAYVKSLQSECLVSGRIGGREDMGDFLCLGDNQVPAGKLECVFETASTMNDTWGYKRDDHNFKSAKEIIELLCGLVSKGGNLLLNIGPKANGEIPEESIDIFKELSGWMKINSEAIYETEASPFMADFSFGEMCQKENFLYCFLHEKQSTISIKGLENNVISAEVLGHGKVKVSKEHDITIDLSGVTFGKYVTVVKIELDKKPKVREGLFSQEKGVLILPGYCAGIVGKSKEMIQGIEEEIDPALEAEKYNLAAGRRISISQAGIVENWYSEKDYIAWEFEVENDLEAEVYLYTLTQKYTSWVGGHKVAIECNGLLDSVILSNDIETTGANKKYFDETGSFCGRVKLVAGKNTLKLFANKINIKDMVGLSVSKIILKVI